MVYGEALSPRQRDLIGREFFVITGKNLVEVLRFQRHFEPEIKNLVTVEGLDAFEKTLQSGRGVIGVTGHIGNFELLAAYLAQCGYPIAVIGRQLYDARLDELLVQNRQAMGITNFATTESPRKILRWLTSGGALGVLIDTDSTRVRGEFVPFFGRLANTPIGQAVLGLRAGAAFFPMACIRTDDDRYKIIIKPEIRITLTGETEKDAYQMTAACVAELEKFIDTYKSQWIWLHNRWHTKPNISP